MLSDRAWAIRAVTADPTIYITIENPAAKVLPKVYFTSLYIPPGCIWPLVDIVLREIADRNDLSKAYFMGLIRYDSYNYNKSANENNSQTLD